MVFFNNSYFLGSALVALLLVAACAYHLNQVTKLAEFIRDSCPQLQGKLRAANRLAAKRAGGSTAFYFSMPMQKIFRTIPNFVGC